MQVLLEGKQIATIFTLWLEQRCSYRMNSLM